MRTFFFSLYGRISVIFLVLLVLLGVTQLFVSVESARNFSRESDQGLNRTLARDMAKSFEPELRGGLDRRAMAGWIHDRKGAAIAPDRKIAGNAGEGESRRFRDFCTRMRAVASTLKPCRKPLGRQEP